MRIAKASRDAMLTCVGRACFAPGLGGAGGTLPLLRALQAAVEAAPVQKQHAHATDDDDQLLLDSRVGSVRHLWGIYGACVNLTGDCGVRRRHIVS